MGTNVVRSATKVVAVRDLFLRAEYVPNGFKDRNQLRTISEVWDGHQHVQDWLGGQPRNRGAANVVHGEDRGSED